MRAVFGAFRAWERSGGDGESALDGPQDRGRTSGHVEPAEPQDRESGCLERTVPTLVGLAVARAVVERATVRLDHEPLGAPDEVDPADPPECTAEVDLTRGFRDRRAADQIQEDRLELAGRRASSPLDARRSRSSSPRTRAVRARRGRRAPRRALRDPPSGPRGPRRSFAAAGGGSRSPPDRTALGPRSHTECRGRRCDATREVGTSRPPRRAPIVVVGAGSSPARAGGRRRGRRAVPTRCPPSRPRPALRTGPSPSRAGRPSAARRGAGAPGR